MEEIRGIYRITNIVTCESYIGSSVDINARWMFHKNVDYAIAHYVEVPRLYADMKKYGLENFRFEILKELPDYDVQNLRRVEQVYITLLHPSYNSVPAYKSAEAKRERVIEYVKTVQENRTL